MHSKIAKWAANESKERNHISLAFDAIQIKIGPVQRF